MDRVRAPRITQRDAEAKTRFAPSVPPSPSPRAKIGWLPRRPPLPPIFRGGGGGGGGDDDDAYRAFECELAAAFRVYRCDYRRLWEKRQLSVPSSHFLCSQPVFLLFSLLFFRPFFTDFFFLDSDERSDEPLRKRRDVKKEIKLLAMKKLSPSSIR